MLPGMSGIVQVKMEKIIFFETEDWESGVLPKTCCGKTCTMIEGALNIDNVDTYTNAEIVSCFIYSDLRRPVLERLPKLRMIATRSTGFDHIDLEYCNNRNIVVANVPTYGEHTVAEHVFALLLALSRHIPQAVNQTRGGDFSLKGLRGFDLFGKTMGIIGTGAIGMHVARIASGFGMNILAYDLSPQPASFLSYVTLEKLLSESDIISLHVPGTAATRHMISDKEFAAMKDGVVLINTARGPVIDVKALLRALQSGKVGAAALDVLPEEPAIREEAELLRASFSQQHDLETLLADHALLHHKNVIVTPHSAFFTKEAVEKILHTTHENILSYLKEKPQNIVNKPQSVRKAAI